MKKNFSHRLRSLHRVFAQRWRARQRNAGFSRIFLCFHLSRSLKAIKGAMNMAQNSVCCSKYYQNDFRYQPKAARREALASDNLALPLIFFNLLR